MELSIIIVNWNSRELVRGCVSSLLCETQQLDYEIIVADAGSFDGCGAMLAKEFPQVIFIQIEGNVGFAKANNIAYTRSTGDLILFLNPDTEVRKGAVNHLYGAVKTLPRTGAVGGKLLNADGTVQTSCIQALPTILNQMLSSEYLRQRWPNSILWGISALYTTSSEPQEVEAISGACVMTSRAAFEQVGRFSEDYFMYAEDIDLSHKFRAAGCINYYIPTATVVHFGGGSSDYAPSSFPAVAARESTWLFLKKTRGWVYASGYRASVAAPAAIRILIGLAGFLFRPVGRARYRRICGKWLAILGWSLRIDRSPRRQLSA